MPMTMNYRWGVRTVQWKEVKEEEKLNEENISRVFDMKGELFEQESKPSDGCLTFLRRKQPRHLKLLVAEGHKSAKLTVYKNRLLGKGGFGVVSLGKLQVRNNDGRVNKMKIAVKSISHKRMRNQFSDDDIVATIGAELRAMTRCQHPNVLGVQFVIIYRDETLIGLELASYGALLHHYSKFPKEVCLQWCTKIMEVVNLCHKKGVMHLDIKPENILLDKDWNIKVADFGLSEVVEDVSTLTDNSFMTSTKAGTRPYMAPEMMYGKTRDGRKCDVWSLGVMLYEMLLEKRPFKSGELFSIITKVRNMRKERKSEAEIRKCLQEVFNIDKVYFPPTFPKAPKVIICAMLNFDPLRRPNLDQILALSWMSNFRVQNCNNTATESHETDHKTGKKTQVPKPTEENKTKPMIPKEITGVYSN